jgi:hypothetical protein
MESNIFLAPSISPLSIGSCSRRSGPKRKCPSMSTMAIKYNIKEGQKLVCTCVKIASASIAKPSHSRYLITGFNHFIVKILDGKDRENRAGIKNEELRMRN